MLTAANACLQPATSRPVSSNFALELALFLAAFQLDVPQYELHEFFYKNLNIV